MKGGVEIETLLDCMSSTSYQYRKWSFVQREWKCTWSLDYCPHKGDKINDHAEEYTIKLARRKHN